MKSLNTLLLSYTTWFSKLACKMGGLTPLNLAAAVMFFLINQITQVLVVFVPIKLLVIIGAGSTPRFVEAILPNVSYEDMIIYLSIGTAVVYFLYMVSDLVLSRTSRFGAAKVSLHANKLSLIDNQTQFTESVYAKVVGTLGGILMVVGGFALGLWIEWRVFSVVLGLVVLEYGFLAYYWGKFQQPSAVSKRLKFITKRIAILRAFSALNFVAGFVILIYIFVTEDYNFLLALVAILLIRQVMIRFILAASDGIYLYQNQAKISALFFSDVKLQEPLGHDDKQFLEALYPANRELLFGEISRLSSIDLQAYEWRWLDNPMRNVAVFIGENEGHEVLLKLFAHKQEKSYLTENTLIDDLGGHPLVMRKLAAGQALGVFYVIQEGSVGEPLVGASFAKGVRNAKLLSWGFDADNALVDRLARSTPLVYERVVRHDLYALSLAGTPNRVIAAFQQKLGLVIPYLERLPVFVWNKNMTAANLYMSAQKHRLIFWNTAVVEPIGSSASIPELESMESEGELVKLSSMREDCRDVQINELKLVSLLHTFDATLNGQNFVAAAKQLPAIEAVIDKCLGTTIQNKGEQ